MYPVAGMARALREADFVVLLLPLTPETRGIIGADALAAMKPTTWLINIARGAVVDEAALLAALHAGKIIAALDVYDHAPLPPDHPLRSAPNTVLSPHLGYCVKETWDLFYPQMIENALAFLDGKPVRVTNPEALRGPAGQPGGPGRYRATAPGARFTGPVPTGGYRPSNPCFNAGEAGAGPRKVRSST